jgi:hypothetical protein
MMEMSSRDKYGFKSLAVGESRFVAGATVKTARIVCGAYVRRHPEMIHKDFVWRSADGGVVVERTR